MGDHLLRHIKVCDSSSFIYDSVIELYLIKVVDDFIQEPNAFLSTVVNIVFWVELVKVRNGSENHSYVLVRMAVKLLSCRQIVKLDEHFKESLKYLLTWTTELSSALVIIRLLFYCIQLYKGILWIKTSVLVQNVISQFS